MSPSGEFIKRSQFSTHSTLENRLALARALITKAMMAKVMRLRMKRAAVASGGFEYKRVSETVESSSLHVAATNFRQLYSVELEKRFSSDEKISDDDLSALKLNWVADYKIVLGGNSGLISRADRVFAHAMNAMERELQGSSNPSPKKKTRKSYAECDLLDMTYDDPHDEADDIEEAEEDETKTPMGKLDALRALPRGAKQLEKAKYMVPGHGFSLLKFYSDERDHHKEAFFLCRRTLSHPAGQVRVRVYLFDPRGVRGRVAYEHLTQAHRDARSMQPQPRLPLPPYQEQGPGGLLREVRQLQREPDFRSRACSRRRACGRCVDTQNR